MRRRPLRTLTVNGIDGGPPAKVAVDLWSAETGESRFWIEDGDVTRRCPDGLWTVMAVLEPGYGDGSPTEQTVVATRTCGSAGHHLRLRRP